MLGTISNHENLATDMGTKLGMHIYEVDHCLIQMLQLANYQVNCSMRIPCLVNATSRTSVLAQ